MPRSLWRLPGSKPLPVLLLAAAIALLPGDSAVAGTLPPAPTQAFSPQSFWNARWRAAAPIDPNSQAMVTGLAGEVDSELARHYGPGINTKQYSSAVYTVGPGQPTVRVAL